MTFIPIFANIGPSRRPKVLITISKTNPLVPALQIGYGHLYMDFIDVATRCSTNSITFIRSYHLEPFLEFGFGKEQNTQL